MSETGLEELKAKLKTSDGGLTQKEAENRIAQYGYNELTEKSKSFSEILFLSLGAYSMDD
jgi:magnesium-transporting ATPase (P-type)